MTNGGFSPSMPGSVLRELIESPANGMSAFQKGNPGKPKGAKTRRPSLLEVDKLPTDKWVELMAKFARSKSKSDQKFFVQAVSRVLPIRDRRAIAAAVLASLNKSSIFRAGGES